MEDDLKPYVSIFHLIFYALPALEFACLGPLHTRHTRSLLFHYLVGWQVSCLAGNLLAAY